ncbi:hypothetical protein FJV41_38350 [Myxococcus llanfairpwllgwyngyllgogerychwyrndrobwllllantysiliogogogochensis]|uniref:Uncharacterized protein n=1 Tax=Myxococcus llanfairpwllgwyngyllgogerychwyrndrobwllllantysiliogogogochensis TaxID=2590453 RepID=A0A540WNR7_9BACT|nr:hypothetical protein [Myxococcus llanfairpwllgwyngyllgogerychwyrndrobwllllantysiliogogogochensis]TQF10661.1 hypothetical protein FJV41_38350 [Myxococcus llanfairpwllgwyngyllgogerychwyrndrobwllllantysiliogogogochensis]
MTLATLLLVALSATQVGDEAQTAPASSAPLTSETLTAPPLMTTPDACPPEAEARYNEGFNALIQGKDTQASEAFTEVLAVCPQHPYATEFGRLTRARLKPGAKLAQAAVYENTERRSGAAVASLTVVQTLHGATQGILLCAIADCRDQGYVAASMLGAGAGVTSALLLSQGGITSGQAAVINSGTVWGFWFGIASMLAFDLEDDDALRAAIIGGAGFTGVGVLLANLVQPTAGQVSMANSGGLWAGVVTALFLATSESDNTKSFFAAELAATSAGIIGFAVLSRSLPVSRGRMLLIDAGGIVGGLLGASTMYTFTGGDDGDSGDNGDAILISAGVGVLGGLALTAYLTRNFDAPRLPQVMLTPTLMGKEGAGMALAGQF